MERKVTIRGNKADLITISKIFKDKNLSIVPDGECFIFKSEFLNVISDENEFRAKVNELLNSVNAYALLFLQSEEKFIYQISEINENGTEIISLKSCAVGYGKAFATICSETEISNSIRDWIEVSENDEIVKEIFIYINSNFNSWFELFKIYEIIDIFESAREIMNSEKYKKKMSDGKYKTGAEIFSQNANYHRHSSKQYFRNRKKNGRPKEPKLTNPPMTLQEAQSFIRDVLREWFKQKYKNSLIKKN